MSNNEIKREIQELRSEIERIRNQNKISFIDILKNMLNRFSIVTGIITAVVVTSLIIYAATITKPHPDFASGDLIDAAQINDNFNTLYTAMNRTGKLIDNGGNILGTVLDTYMNAVNVISPNGYIVQYNWDGSNNSEMMIYYSGTDCTGSVYFDASYGTSILYGKFTAYNKISGIHYAPNSIDSNGLAVTTTSVPFQSSYTGMAGSCNNGSNTVTIPVLMKEVTLSEMGLPATVTLPLSIE